MSEKSSISLIDWTSFAAALGLSVLGLITMSSFTSGDPFVSRQIIWIIIGVIVFFAASTVNWRILRRSGVAAGIYIACLMPLIVLIVLGHATQGAKSWFDLGPFALQPVEFVKLALVITLAKYFSRRHTEIRNIRHIFISGTYAAIVFVLVALQPDFGSALIIFTIWLGMVLMSGISRLHLAIVFLVGIAAFGGLWLFGFQPYQRERILTFLHPLADVRGAGYNAYQATVAVGSGELFGKGIGYGTQSKLRFLPEYQTDFIFAAFAEEWGFVGICIAFLLYGILFWRIASIAMHGASNFETLFALGIFFYFLAHFTLHVGINLGLLPVTGTTIPFMSYGGSHIIVEFLALGMLSGMRAYGRVAPRHALNREFKGGYDALS
ncbi:MAG TPA: FtsW/RodA/SpoVE family cell cycle protein [Candidatus Paceibacterota bacterium]|nr:FtsW/RodA/SpoVE family cell cycle protein [Candidatus Paceibacterota bacterium]